MKLSTGKIAFPIEFDNGDVSNIYFNPNDPDLFVRFSDFEKRTEAKIKDITDVKLTSEGTPEDANLVEQFRELNKIICEELDVAFGGNISEVVFKYCSPFAIVAGDYFLLHFLNAIRPELEKHNKKANAEIQKKMNKHIAKYKK